MKRLPRFWRLLWALTIAAGLISLGSAHWIPSEPSRLDPHPVRVNDRDPPASHEVDKMVVCYGHVDVEYGVTSLYPSQHGRVAEVLVHESDLVSAGTVLLRLENRLPRLRVEEARAALESAQSQLAQAEQMTERHRAQLAMEQAAVTAARHRMAGALRVLEGKKQLQAIEDVGRNREDPVRAEEVAAALEKVRELEADLKAEGQKLVDLQLQDPLLEVQRARADVATMQSRLDQARQTLDDCDLKAPEAGTVLRVLVGPGDTVGVQPKEPAVQFCPNRPRLIRAEVDQEFAGRVAVGLAALVEDDVSSGTTWRGRVSRLSDWYTRRRSVFDDTLQLKDVRTLECLITLDPGQPPLRIGQRVRITIGRVPP